MGPVPGWGHSGMGRSACSHGGGHNARLLGRYGRWVAVRRPGTPSRAGGQSAEAWVPGGGDEGTGHGQDARNLFRRPVENRLGRRGWSVKGKGERVTLGAVMQEPLQIS